MGPGLGGRHNSERLVAGPLPMGSGGPEETWDPLSVAQHLQEGPKWSDAKSFGRQPKQGTLAVQSRATEACSRDMERHLSDGEASVPG